MELVGSKQRLALFVLTTVISLILLTGITLYSVKGEQNVASVPVEMVKKSTVIPSSQTNTPLLTRQNPAFLKALSTEILSTRSLIIALLISAVILFLVFIFVCFIRKEREKRRLAMEQLILERAMLVDTAKQEREKEKEREEKEKKRVANRTKIILMSGTLLLVVFLLGWMYSIYLNGDTNELGEKDHNGDTDEFVGYEPSVPLPADFELDPGILETVVEFRPQQDRRLQGLPNLGLSCFLNSALQCIAWTIGDVRPWLAALQDDRSDEGVALKTFLCVINHLQGDVAVPRPLLTQVRLDLYRIRCGMTEAATQKSCDLVFHHIQQLAESTGTAGLLWDAHYKIGYEPVRQLDKCGHEVRGIASSWYVLWSQGPGDTDTDMVGGFSLLFNNLTKCPVCGEVDADPTRRSRKIVRPGRPIFSHVSKHAAVAMNQVDYANIARPDGFEWGGHRWGEPEAVVEYIQLGGSLAHFVAHLRRQDGQWVCINDSRVQDGSPSPFAGSKTKFSMLIYPHQEIQSPQDDSDVGEDVCVAE